jgi:hypothetical protein
MPGKKENTMWVVIAAAIAAGIYLMTKKPVTVTPQTVPVAPVNNTLSYITPESGVSDIISSLSVSSTVAPAQTIAPLQLTPPDSATLEPMNLDLIQRPGQSEDEESTES